ncbi:ATP-binding protein [Succinatimonas hippei]|uniref:ATP-binding protein n=1 Tax=Succinatimonas hippei TaxID=626938 RepID=UPI002492918B|nr:ATP-binding protein [Succinatimonas hippei]
MTPVNAKHYLHDDIIRKLTELKLAELSDYVDELCADPECVNLDFIGKFEVITNRLYQNRINELINNLLKNATLREPQASIAGLYYESERLLSRELMIELGTCDFMRSQTNIIIEGPTGAGKCYRVKYIRLPDLQQELEDCYHYNRSLKNLKQKYIRPALLVIDEWMMRASSDSLSSFLLDVMEGRYTTSSTVFCTQSKQESWHAMLGGNTMAEAIIDRIVQNSLTITLGNLNMRALRNPLMKYKNVKE